MKAGRLSVSTAHRATAVGPISEIAELANWAVLIITSLVAVSSSILSDDLNELVEQTRN